MPTSSFDFSSCAVPDSVRSSQAERDQSPDCAARTKPDTPPSPEPQQPGATAERDTRGRFARGNKGGPGNPWARKIAALRQAMLNIVKPEDLQAIIARLVLEAQQGDLAAARLVLHYTVGKPAESVDPDTLDLHEWSLFQQLPVSNEALQSLLGPLQVPLACLQVRTVLPLVQDSVAQQLAQHLQPPPPPPTSTQAPPQPVASVPLDRSPAVAAQSAKPAPHPEPAPQTPLPKRQAPTANQNGASKEHDTQRRAAPPAGAAVGVPTAATAADQAEIPPWLALCARILRPDLSARDSPDAHPNRFAAEPGIQG